MASKEKKRNKIDAPKLSGGKEKTNIDSLSFSLAASSLQQHNEKKKMTEKCIPTKKI